MSAVSQYETGEFSYALGDSLQSLGAGLETIADLYALRKPEINIQPVATLGALFQAMGSNLIATLSTKEFRDLK